jgi:hypothetical protein
MRKKRNVFKSRLEATFTVVLCRNVLFLMPQVRLESGRKLQYQVNGATAKDEVGFVTLIRYDRTDARSGQATALFNWRTGAMEV